MNTNSELAKIKYTSGKLVEICNGKTLQDWLSPLQKDPIIGEIAEENSTEIKIEQP